MENVINVFLLLPHIHKGNICQNHWINLILLSAFCMYARFCLFLCRTQVWAHKHILWWQKNKDLLFLGIKLITITCHLEKCRFYTFIQGCNPNILMELCNYFLLLSVPGYPFFCLFIHLYVVYIHSNSEFKTIFLLFLKCLL